MSIFFHKGKENILESKKEQGAEQIEIKKIQDAFLKVLDNKNLSLIFDPDKPIPVKINNQYGYISAKNGKTIIRSN